MRDTENIMDINYNIISGYTSLNVACDTNITGELNVYGHIFFNAGISTTKVITSGVLKDFYTSINTVGTSETDFYTYTLPSNILANNGDKIIFTVNFHNTSATTDASIIFNYSGNTFNLAEADSLQGTHKGILEIIRVSSTVCRVVINGSRNYGASTVTSYVELTSQNFTTTNIIKTSGICSSGTLTAVSGYIEYKPAGIN